MADNQQFSEKTLASPEAKSPEALERIAIAKFRIQSILDREIVSHQKTLEQKISDQGPNPIRVDPHLVGKAIADLLELNRLRRHTHPATGKKQSWFSNPATDQTAINERLDQLAPLYDSVTQHGFGNLVGDALEIVVQKCLEDVQANDPRYVYQGHFRLDLPKDKHGRYKKSQPPKTVGSRSTKKEADFLQFGYAEGALCIECKNYREWVYPHHGVIKELIVKAADLNLIPVLITRRLHYTSRTNLLEPAGIIAHETYHQYYPSDQSELAEAVRHKRSLGFTDIRATEDPNPRTRKFFNAILPSIVPRMAALWNSNKDQLVRYANDEINLAQIYTEIGSPAGGKWQDFNEQPPDGIWD